ncbi:hypothetical protein V6N11_037580 [Hibiscus sabdariffa]|uniref:Uncharacterized protein n=2 Tax=Hibiscus sabdariffa TaxID=183260 RepID=A0ABR2BNA5_9ROSI
MEKGFCPLQLTEPVWFKTRPTRSNLVSHGPIQITMKPYQPKPAPDNLGPNLQRPSAAPRTGLSCSRPTMTCFGSPIYLGFGTPFS